MASELIGGVDFVSLGTTDLDRARKFYGETLGLEAGPLWRDADPVGAEFETGTVTIALMDTAKLGIDFSANRSPIALHVEDFERARSELETRGVSFLTETIDSGVCWQTFFEDPDGNMLGLHHRYKPPPG